MASNVFDNTLDVNNQVNVNSFDWSHKSHVTTEFGRITPVGFWDVPPKTTARITPTLALQLMPMVFPVQTSMRARLNFFKVEKRALNNDYTDMVSGVRQDIEEPYIALSRDAFPITFGTSHLSDYLGLPSKITKFTKSTLSATSVVSYVKSEQLTIGSTFKISTSSAGGYDLKSVSYPSSHKKLSIQSKIQLQDLNILFVSGSGPSFRIVDLLHFDDVLAMQTLEVSTLSEYDALYLALPASQNPTGTQFTVTALHTPVYEEINADNTTFGLSNSPNKISAYPFRAYEAVYNAYYRDSRNNPYILEGKPVYNKWIPRNSSGADDFPYSLHYANWERDAFTTAVPNPQQGIKAPLAGLTTYDTVRTLDTGEVKHEVATALVLDNGEKYALDYQTNADGTALTGVSYTKLNGNEETRPVTTLAELASTGLSIETLRYVNAYQKYLELNMRKGFSYRDIMQGRWDIEIRFDELLMPTFIGGISREINMNAVQQTVDNASPSDSSYESALGSQAGIAGFYGGTDNNIECFCDESSIIIACLTIVPTPVYSQLTPKTFFYRDILDAPTPEFQNIGFQPIYKKELNIFDPDGDEVFGYQRPWYEYCQQFDTAHGAFRDTMGNFLMQRVFAGTPELSKSFLTVNPADLTDVFSVTTIGENPINDHIYGYIDFNMTVKLPINRVAIPRLD